MKAAARCGLEQLATSCRKELVLVIAVAKWSWCLEQNHKPQKEKEKRCWLKEDLILNRRDVEHR